MVNPLTINCPVRVGVVGAGHWGKNLIRNFEQLGALAAVCDAVPRPELQQAYPQVAWYTDWRDLLHHAKLDAVVIATPSHTHFEIASQSLMLGKHVYVEKPMTTNSDQAAMLLSLSQQEDRILMVGHLLLYHPAVNRLKQLIQDGALGDIKAVQSDRLSYNPNRPDTNVLWDLAPHDLSLVCYLLDAEAEQVLQATGHRVGNDGRMDDIHATMRFPAKTGSTTSASKGQSVTVDIHTSWVHPVKHVQLVVHGSLATAVLNDVHTSNQLQLFTHIEGQKLPVASTPDWLALEPLKLECQHFVSCLTQHAQPRSDATNGLAIVRQIEAIEACLHG
jgi:UDP-2-acetamido-3-amino-2,3-dideoxy-glucuronate N-acetyltransferase